MEFNSSSTRRDDYVPYVGESFDGNFLFRIENFFEIPEKDEETNVRHFFLSIDTKHNFSL